MTSRELRFACTKCGLMHVRRNLAIECCHRDEVLTMGELEAIGQERLFDADGAEPLVPAIAPDDNQFQLF